LFTEQGRPKFFDEGSQCLTRIRFVLGDGIQPGFPGFADSFIAGRELLKTVEV
jgi:hypothetical protein